jgi:hypothetical protein
MLEPISKNNITKNIQNIFPLIFYKEKDKHLSVIDDSNDYTIINYWHEEF